MSKFLLDLRTITNATKAQIGATINALLGVLIAFHVVFTQTQLAAIGIAINAVLALFTAVTFTQSTRRTETPVPPNVAKGGN